MSRLDLFDRHWFIAFHELREGVSLPIRPLKRWFGYDGPGVTRRLRQLERMGLAEYWADFLSHQPPGSRRPDWEPPSLSAHREQVEWLKRNEAQWLTQQSDPERIRMRSQGVKVWDALWRAGTIPKLAETCQQWMSLHRDEPWEYQDPLPGRNAYPVRILDHAKQFLALKKDRRFPRSAQADRPRMDYLARAMAGLDLGLSPSTAVERLRNMKHGPGGPLWSDQAQRCSCWRCLFLKDRDTFYEQLGEAQ